MEYYCINKIENLVLCKSKLDYSLKCFPKNDIPNEFNVNTFATLESASYMKEFLNKHAKDYKNGWLVQVFKEDNKK